MRIYFIGIGGIGVSALVRYYLAQDFLVSGSDAGESQLIDDLRREGAEISSGLKTDKMPDLVIYSAAVPEDHPELVEARRHNVKCQKYAQALGELTKEKFTIAVSGMHGKSTTTAMIGLILEAARLDPTVIVGTKVKWNSPRSFSNFRFGKSQYLVIEADEYDQSFLNYWPKIIVLTNIEEEHLDTYKDLTDIMKTFGEYVGHLPDDGILVANEEDANIRVLIQNSKFKIQNYNTKEIPAGLNLKIPGQHILSDAMAALTVARALNVPDEISIKALNDFSGTWRRMEFRGELNGAKIYDDYGHHPTEIKATLEGVRELLDGRRLFVVFSPHQYQRTYYLFDKFVSAFDAADKIILLPIYSVAGREDEEIKKKISSEKLAQAIKQTGQDAIYLESFQSAEKYLRENLQKGDVCVIMGAGDIYKLTEELLGE